MFDLHCKAATAIELKSTGLVAQKMTYGVEYLIIVKPFEMYIKGNAYLIKVDGKALMSDQTTFMKDTITTNDDEFFNMVPIFARVLDAFYMYDRTILHVRISITADEHSKLNKLEKRYADSIGARAIDVSTLRSIPKVVDKIFRNGILDRNSKLTKAERDRTVPFNVITQNTKIALKPFSQLDISTPVNDVSQLVTTMGDISNGENNHLKITTVGNEAIFENVDSEQQAPSQQASSESNTKTPQTPSTEESYTAASNGNELLASNEETETIPEKGNRNKAQTLFKNKFMAAVSITLDKLGSTFEAMSDEEIESVIKDMNDISSEAFEKILDDEMGFEGITKEELLSSVKELKNATT